MQEPHRLKLVVIVVMFAEPPKISQPKMEDCMLKVRVIVQLMHEVGSKGEFELVQWICGSHLAWTEKFKK